MIRDSKTEKKPHVENNHEEWKEIRSRIDSIANAVFLISGGALSLSISVLINNKTNGIILNDVASKAECAWHLLLVSVILFLFLKGTLILQSYILQFKTDFMNRYLHWFNCFCWIIGVLGFIAFAVGLVELVNVAASIISAEDVTETEEITYTLLK